MESHYKYEIHKPNNPIPGIKYPTIFALHGKGSNEKDLPGLLAPLFEDFIVISIRGDISLGMGYQYYDLISLGNPNRETFDPSIQKLEVFIDDATQKYPVDPAKRYLLGFSQGAILSMTLALTMGDQIKGIVALNGYVPEFVKTEFPLKSVEHVSVFISHGEFDQVFPIRIGHETANYFQTKAKKVDFKTYPIGHGVSQETQQDIVSWLAQDASGAN